MAEDIVQIQRLRGNEADKASSTRVPAEGQIAVVLDEEYAVLGDGSTAISGLRPMGDRRIATADHTATYTITDVGPSIVACDSAGGAVTVALPTLADNIGRRIYLININADNDININAEGSDVIGANAESSITVASSVTTTILIGTAAYWEQVATGGGGGTFIGDPPIGQIGEFGMGSAPVGWLECDGSAVSRAQYSELFAVIGTTWGAGDGSTTFNVPDLRGAFLRGAGSHGSETMADGNAFAGPAVGAFEDDQLQGHWHTSPFLRFSTSTSSNNANTIRIAENAAGTDVDTVQDPLTDSTNGTPRTGDETRPFAAGVTYCIKASRVTVTGDMVTALRYDTGWVAIPSAGNSTTVTHNLGAERDDLVIEAQVRDGSGNVSDFVWYYDSSDATEERGEIIKPNDSNSILVQASAGGASGINSSGVAFTPTEYRVVVYKPEIISRISAGNVRSVTGDYTITGPLDAPSILVTTGATDRTVTLPAGTAMTPGDTIDVTKVDSGAGKVTVSRAGSDTIDGLTSKDVVGQDAYIKFRWSGTTWQVIESRGARPVANAVRVGSHEYQFTEDNELDYTSSFTNGGSGTVTFTELPENTVEVLLFVRLDVSGNAPEIRFGRSATSNNTVNVAAIFADAGSLNRLSVSTNVPTSGNTVYYSNATFGAGHKITIFGYKVAE